MNSLFCLKSPIKQNAHAEKQKELIENTTCRTKRRRQASTGGKSRAKIL